MMMMMKKKMIILPGLVVMIAFSPISSIMKEFHISCPDYVIVESNSGNAQ